MKTITFRKIRKCMISIIVLMVALIMPLTAQAKGNPKLNKAKASVAVGFKVQLKVKNTSSKATWTSSNKKVAAVSKKGLVLARKAGKATITAKVSGKKAEMQDYGKEE